MVEFIQNTNGSNCPNRRLCIQNGTNYSKYGVGESLERERKLKMIGINGHSGFIEVMAKKLNELRV